MSSGKVKKCSKCGGEMKRSKFWYGRVAPQWDVTVRVKDDAWGIGDDVLLFYCTQCGFIELYKRMNEKK